MSKQAINIFEVAEPKCCSEFPNCDCAEISAELSRIHAVDYVEDSPTRLTKELEQEINNEFRIERIRRKE